MPIRPKKTAKEIYMEELRREAESKYADIHKWIEDLNNSTLSKTEDVNKGFSTFEKALEQMPMNYGVIINNHLFLKTNPTYYDSSERSFSYYRYYATPVRKIFDCELEHKDFNFSDETQVVINKEDNSFQAHVPPSKLTLGDQSVCVFGYTAPETYHVRKFSNLLNLKLDDADISYVGVVDQAIDHPSL